MHAPRGRRLSAQGRRRQTRVLATQSVRRFFVRVVRCALHQESFERQQRRVFGGLLKLPPAHRRIEGGRKVERERARSSARRKSGLCRSSAVLRTPRASTTCALAVSAITAARAARGAGRANPKARRILCQLLGVAAMARAARGEAIAHLRADTAQFGGRQNAPPYPAGRSENLLRCEQDLFRFRRR